MVEPSTVFALDSTNFIGISFTLPSEELYDDFESADDILMLSCFEPAYETVVTSMKHIIKGSAPTYRSILINSPPGTINLLKHFLNLTSGAGKSSLLCLSALEAKKNGFQILRIGRGTSFVHRDDGSSPPSSINDALEAISRFKKGREASVNELLEFLFQINGSKTVYLPSSPLLILCDDAESILFSMKCAVNGTLDDSDNAKDGLENEHSIANSIVLESLLSSISASSIAMTDDAQIMIIACCSLTVKEIESSLGRLFEKTVEIQRPNLVDREHLFSRHLADIPLENVDDHVYRTENKRYHDCGMILPLCRVWAFHMAILSRGYRPGDIMRVINRIRSMIPQSDDSGAKLQWDVVLKTLASIRPQQIESLKDFVKHIDPDILKLSWEDFVGYDDVKERVKRILRQVNAQMLNFNKTSLRHIFNSQSGGIIIHGPTGNGKSHLAKIIASESKGNFISVRCTELLSKYFSETESNIRAVFQGAVAPCIIFFDEFDVFAHRRYFVYPP